MGLGYDSRTSFSSAEWMCAKVAPCLRTGEEGGRGRANVIAAGSGRDMKGDMSNVGGRGTRQLEGGVEEGRFTARG